MPASGQSSSSGSPATATTTCTRSWSWSTEVARRSWRQGSSPDRRSSGDGVLTRASLPRAHGRLGAAVTHPLNEPAPVAERLDEDLGPGLRGWARPGRSARLRSASCTRSCCEPRAATKSSAGGLRSPTYVVAISRTSHTRAPMTRWWRSSASSMSFAARAGSRHARTSSRCTRPPPRSENAPGRVREMPLSAEAWPLVAGR
jgi:hypothetical protein